MWESTHPSAMKRNTLLETQLWDSLSCSSSQMSALHMVSSFPAIYVRSVLSSQAQHRESTTARAAPQMFTTVLPCAQLEAGTRLQLLQRMPPEEFYCTFCSHLFQQFICFMLSVPGKIWSSGQKSHYRRWTQRSSNENIIEVWRSFKLQEFQGEQTWF